MIGSRTDRGYDKHHGPGAVQIRARHNDRHRPEAETYAMNRMSAKTSGGTGEYFSAELAPAQLDSLRSGSREFTLASVFVAVLATLALWPMVTHDSLMMWTLFVGRLVAAA